MKSKKTHHHEMKMKTKKNQILSGTFDCSDNRRKKFFTGDVV
jgi:hypothetical protein